MKKYYKTTFKIEILSQDKDVSNLELSEVSYAIVEGDCSGDIEVTEVKELTPVECATALIEQGSDPGFFQLSEDGVDLKTLEEVFEI